MTESTALTIQRHRPGRGSLPQITWSRRPARLRPDLRPYCRVVGQGTRIRRRIRRPFRPFFQLNNSSVAQLGRAGPGRRPAGVRLVRGGAEPPARRSRGPTGLAVDHRRGVGSAVRGVWDERALAGGRLPGGRSVHQELAFHAFTAGNLEFANGWVAMGNFAVCVRVGDRRGQTHPRWLGWAAIVSGIGLVVSRAFYTTGLWLAPYALFWFVLIVLSIRLVRVGRVRVGSADRGAKTVA